MVLWRSRFVCVCALVVMLMAVGADAFSLLKRMGAPVGLEGESPITVYGDSMRSQRSLVPYDFFYLNICRPSKEQRKKARKVKGLGQILLGHRVRPTMYRMNVGVDQKCTMLCDSKSIQKRDLDKLKRLIKRNYHANMRIDGLPVLFKKPDEADDPPYQVGYPLGEMRDTGRSAEYTIYNHLEFTIQHVPQDFDDDDDKGYSVITGVFVTPRSVDHMIMPEFCADTNSSTTATPNPKTFGTLDLPGPSGMFDIQFSYSVKWVSRDDNNVAARWDNYITVKASGGRQASAMVNTFLVACGLGFMVAIVVVRTVRRDLKQYAADNELLMDADEQGWKLVRGDVFRTPEYPLALVGVISGGLQLLLMGTATVLAGWIGLVNAYKPGSILSAILLFFVLTSVVAGLCTGCLLNYFDMRSWKNASVAVSIVPVWLFCLYFFLNLLQWSQRGSAAIPFLTLLGVLCWWLLVSFPLALLGVSWANRWEPIKPPTKVSRIPRIIPNSASKTLPLYLLVAGVLPFLSSLVVTSLVFYSVWQGEVFFFFGFVIAMGFLTSVVCAEVAIVLIYLTLNREHYNWWWNSFLGLASSSLYFFVHSGLYMVTRLRLRGIVSTTLYFGYSLGMSVTFGLLTGCIGFFSAFAFVWILYSSAKAD